MCMIFDLMFQQLPNTISILLIIHGIIHGLFTILVTADPFAEVYRIEGFVCEVLNCANYARGCELAKFKELTNFFFNQMH